MNEEGQGVRGINRGGDREGLDLRGSVRITHIRIPHTGLVRVTRWEKSWWKLESAILHSTKHLRLRKRPTTTIY